MPQAADLNYPESLGKLVIINTSKARLCCSAALSSVLPGAAALVPSPPHPPPHPLTTRFAAASQPCMERGHCQRG